MRHPEDGITIDAPERFHWPLSDVRGYWGQRFAKTGTMPSPADRQAIIEAIAARHGLSGDDLHELSALHSDVLGSAMQGMMVRPFRNETSPRSKAANAERYAARCEVDANFIRFAQPTFELPPLGPGAAR